MKHKEWEQLVYNKKNDSVVKVTTIQEEYKDGDKVIIGGIPFTMLEGRIRCEL